MKITETTTAATTDILRFITAGSVDDGKSTLIGRLMYDTKLIFKDQLHAIEQSSMKRGDEQINLAHLTDGLKAEREQGITIDVAYRYFATQRRKFIMADTPGHIQYTRNMVTGASTAQLAIILIDARHGVVEQTRRHSYIVALLGIKHVVVCINKMDLVKYDESVFATVRQQYLDAVASLSLLDIHFIPISALSGDNVVDTSPHMPWYTSPTLLHLLETINISAEMHAGHARFPVQRVIRPQSQKYPDFRGYAGRVEGGIFRPGDEVTILPSGVKTKIDKIYVSTKEVDEAYSPMSVTITLTDHVDVSRGDMIVSQDELHMPTTSRNVRLVINWFSDTPMNPKGSYLLKHTTREVKASIVNVAYKVDVHTFEKVVIDVSVQKNDIAEIELKTHTPLFYDRYADNRTTGAVILIDETTNETVAAGMVV